ncbi:Wzz/FepE/Etk N-terminal domain-containing protein [Bradyrhizobium sp.]|uniref:Wzz/FepE/Etk N-terminal domain-containing protein n=1 Tax=Bradyrhizobium sp. TaxID=376 RepID=UPI00273745C1|nr:Wzz/FepE/Etk N-terminal domain-containing protein [Bradyrhizobium sp.]MDP3077408.1 Wzz/FepE/Etk N-terminal domain-containing protein [Bradyrhizobium sp.]
MDTARSDGIFDQELVGILYEHWKLLIIVPVVAAAIGYLIAAFVPVQYASQTFLRINPQMARDYSALLKSPAIAETILAQYPETGATPEAKARYMNTHLFFKDQEPHTAKAAVRLYRIDAYHRDPGTATHILLRSIKALSLDPVIATQPHEPQEPAWPNKRGFALLSGLISIPVSFALLILFRFYRAGTV